MYFLSKLPISRFGSNIFSRFFNVQWRIFYLINATTLSFWWVLANPGFYSSDSIGVLERVWTRQLSSEWTYLWDVLVFIFTFAGYAPHFATLIFGLILVTAFTYFCQQYFKGSSAKLISFLISISPLISGFGITLWHDVPMTAGFLLFVAILAHPKNLQRKEFVLFGIACVLINTRLNGLWTILIVILLLGFAKIIHPKTCLQLLLILLFISLPFSILNSSKARYDNAQISGLTHWMKYDVSCSLSKRPAESETILLLEKQNIRPKELSSDSSCGWFMDGSALKKWESINQKNVILIWSSEFSGNIGSLLSIHSNRSQYLVPNPIRVASRPPFLHSTIEFDNPWVREWRPALYEIGRYPSRLWNFLGSFTANGGLFWIVICFASVLRSNLVAVALLATVLNFTVFITAIIPDARYIAFTLIVGSTIALVILTNLFSRIIRKMR